jgi:hypothetical protein
MIKLYNSLTQPSTKKATVSYHLETLSHSEDPLEVQGEKQTGKME